MPKISILWLICWNWSCSNSSLGRCWSFWTDLFWDHSDFCASGFPCGGFGMKRTELLETVILCNYCNYDRDKLLIQPASIRMQVPGVYCLCIGLPWHSSRENRSNDTICSRYVVDSHFPGIWRGEAKISRRVLCSDRKLAEVDSDLCWLIDGSPGFPNKTWKYNFPFQVVLMINLPKAIICF